MAIENVRGIKEVIRGLHGHREKTRKAMKRGIKKACEFALRQSKKIVPIETGAMANSGYVEIKETAATVKGSVGFNKDGSVPYTMIVHEDLEAAHGSEYNAKYADDIRKGTKTRRRPQEQAKFLEQPFRENRPQIAGLVKEAMSKK